jgi:non-canonical purine NTP pyrophosphatase (RdgB/HAM1 family)
MHNEKSIYYATSNSGKFSEIQRYCKNYAPDVEVKQFKYDLPELQHNDQLTVAIHKAEAAWNLLQKPVLVDDSGLFINRYKGFPGIMSKYAMHCLGLEGIMRLINDQEPAQFIVTLAFAYEPGKVETFQGICHGNLIKIKEMPEKDHLPYSNFFVPDGHYLPYAQLRGTPAEKTFGPRHKALSLFFHWFLAENS